MDSRGCSKEKIVLQCYMYKWYNILSGGFFQISGIDRPYMRISMNKCICTVYWLKKNLRPGPRILKEFSLKVWHSSYLLYQGFAERCFFIPRATSCGGYNVFDPSVSLSVSQSVCQSCFSCQRNSSETAQQNFVKLCSYEGHNV